jgi:hypothetical protein
MIHKKTFQFFIGKVLKKSKFITKIGIYPVFILKSKVDGE